jgi:hypothetical protein
MFNGLRQGEIEIESAFNTQNSSQLLLHPSAAVTTPNGCAHLLRSDSIIINLVNGFPLQHALFTRLHFALIRGAPFNSAAIKNTTTKYP